MLLPASRALEFAKLGESANIQEDQDEDDEPEGADLHEESKRKIYKVPPPPPNRPGMRQVIFPLDEGDVVLQLPEKLSQESFEDFEDWLQLILRKTKRSLAEKDPPDDGSDLV